MNTPITQPNPTADMTNALIATGNPLHPGIGLTDPHVSIYGDTAYLYATHDFSPESENFVTKDWWVWSSTDLVKWRHDGTLRPEDTFVRRASDECWAGFCASKNGKYYWYFSAGPTEIGVVVADSPTGPWSDPLGKPLVALGLTPTEQRDPDVFTDDDGQSYLIYGTFQYFIAHLNDDMISLAERPRLVELDREFGPYGEGQTDDKPALHKRNGLYYLSWSSFYATAPDVYGPYTYKGSVIVPENVAPEFHIDEAARGYNLWHDRHGNFFTWHNQWFYVFNDKSSPGRTDHFRDSCLSYVHYRDNGDIAPISLNRIGVGQYDAAQSHIEAEDYFAAKNAEVKESPAGGFEVRGLKSGSCLSYPNVRNLPRHAVLSLHIASNHPAGATIEVRAGDAQARVLASYIIPCTGGWDKYQTVSCSLKNEGESESIFLVFQGASDELARLDWIAFAER